MDDELQTNTQAELRLNHEACADLQLEKIPSELFAVAGGHAKPFEGEMSFKLCIEYKQDKLAGDIFTPKAMPDMVPLRDHLRSQSKIFVFFHGGIQVKRDFDRLVEQFRVDNECSPLHKWRGEDKGRLCLQRGQYL